MNKHKITWTDQEKQILDFLDDKIHTSRQIAIALNESVDEIKNALQRLRYHKIIELVNLYYNTTGKKQRFWKLTNRDYPEIQGDMYISSFSDYFDYEFAVKDE